MAADVKRERFLRNINRWLFILLLLMIAGFFTWSESILVTRGIKVVGRMGVLVALFLVYRSIINKGAINSLVYKNIFVSGLYLAYMLLGFISMAWSTNPGFSALQWFMIMQSLVFAYFFVKSIRLLDLYFEGHPIKLHRMLGNAVFVLQLVFIIGMWLDPDTFFRLTNGGEEARLGGVIMNPNELGMLAGVGVAALIFDLNEPKKRIWTSIKIALIFYALFMTGSRSSLIGVFIIIFFHIGRAKNRSLKFGIASIILLMAPFAIYQIILKGGDQSRLDEIMSLTGRLPFWKALITEGLPREPLLGFGFMRIDYGEFFQSVHTYSGKMTHNTFIQVLMNLGFVGLVIVLFQMLFTVRAIFLEKNETKLLLVGIFIPIIINSFTEFGVFGESNYGILFFQMMIFLVTFQNRKYLTSKERLKLRKNNLDFFQKV